MVPGVVDENVELAVLLAKARPNRPRVFGLGFQPPAGVKRSEPMPPCGSAFQRLAIVGPGQGTFSTRPRAMKNGRRFGAQQPVIVPTTSCPTRVENDPLPTLLVIRQVHNERGSTMFAPPGALRPLFFRPWGPLPFQLVRASDFQLFLVRSGTSLRRAEKIPKYLP